FWFWTAEQRVEQLNFRKSPEERKDHWLDGQVIAARCERVAPRFQVMCKRNMPVAERRCGILMITKPHNLRHLFLQISPVERQLRFAVLHQPALCVVNRITAENEQLLDPTVVYVRRELRNIYRARIVRNLPD